MREKAVRTYKELKPSVLKLTLLICIALLALIRSNYYYKDDVGRFITGHRGWDEASRHVTQGMAYLLNTGSTVMDLSPVTLILAVFFMAVSCVVIAYVYAGKVSGKLGWIQLIATLSLGLCPMFLENYSFKYDCVYMAFSVMVSVLPILFLDYRENKKDKYLMCVAVFAGALLTCMTYQASLGILPVLVAFLSMKRWNNGEWTFKEVVIRDLTAAVSFVAAVAFYKVALVKKVPIYMSSDVMPLRQLPRGLMNNLGIYTRMLRNTSRPLWLWLVVAVTLCFLVVEVMKSKRNKLVSLLSWLACIAAGYVMSMGMELLIKRPRMQARQIYAIGVVLCCISVGVSYADRLQVTKILCVALSWCFVTFAVIYGNTLSEQIRYTEYRTYMLIDDLEDLGYMDTDEPIEIRFNSSIHYTPAMKLVSDTYPLLRHLVTNMLGKYMWGRTYLLNMYGFDHMTKGDKKDFEKLDLPKLKENVFETIYGDETHILVELR